MSSPVIVYSTNNKINEQRNPPSYQQALRDLERMREEKETAELFRCIVTIVRRTGGPGKKGESSPNVETLFHGPCTLELPARSQISDQEFKIAPRTFAKIKKLLQVAKPHPNDPFVQIHESLDTLYNE